MRNLAAVAVLVVGLLLARHHGGILVAALVLAWLLAGSGSSGPALAGGRYVAGHAHGQRKFIARHEGGHAVAAKAVGGQVTSAWLTDDEGLVRARIPDDPVKVVAFLAAGRAAVSSGRGCSADDAAIRAELRSVPSAQRGQVRRDGVRLARRITSSRAGEVNRVAARLNEKGQL
jgi:hypothetical protein